MFSFYRVFCCVLLLLLTGCSALKIDHSHQSDNYDNRIQWIVLHYTSADLEHSLHLLTKASVSSHYLISDQPVKVYQLVDEAKRAWHAGDSSWHGRTWLNATSIGIEVVHPGYLETQQGRQWVHWPEAQVDILLHLLRDIIERYQLPIDSVIGHSDIAPLRKVDPGPMFPWIRLAQEGMIRWPLHEHMRAYEPIYSKELPSIKWIQQQLKAIGYAIEPTGDHDETTQKTLSAVQMKYRPRDFSGSIDAETAAILHSLAHQIEQAR